MDNPNVITTKANSFERKNGYVISGPSGIGKSEELRNQFRVQQAEMLIEMYKSLNEENEESQEKEEKEKSKKPMILVTGGTGYIGSHTVVELIENGYDVTIIDNLSNSSETVIDKIEEITGLRPYFIKEDIRNESEMDWIFQALKPEAVIHFAGLKAVGESVEKPLEYYDNNVGGTITLLKVMKKNGCNKIVFSSSATVYGAPDIVPIDEDSPLRTTNPYGTTKLHIEQMLVDICNANKDFSATLLRYFNPVGAHKSALIGENPNGIPNNLMPRIINVALGKMDKITVFGTDYPTKDGTGVRDYIHVTDLAKGHLKALDNMNGLKTYNLGTGTGYSVMELIDTFNKVNNQNVEKVICERRPGDISECFANPEKAFNELGWKTELTIEDMCKSAWEYAKNNL
jgi:UDP-glucose 4-epimerase